MNHPIRLIKHAPAHGLNKILHETYKFVREGRKLSINQRGVRLAIGLVEPVLSLTGMLNRPWEIGLELISIFMVVTSFTGVCFAGKIWRMIWKNNGK